MSRLTEQRRRWARMRRRRLEALLVKLSRAELRAMCSYPNVCYGMPVDEESARMMSDEALQREIEETRNTLKQWLRQRQRNRGRSR